MIRFNISTTACRIVGKFGDLAKQGEINILACSQACSVSHVINIEMQHDRQYCQ